MVSSKRKSAGKRSRSRCRRKSRSGLCPQERDQGWTSLDDDGDGDGDGAATMMRMRMGNKGATYTQVALLLPA